MDFAFSFRPSKLAISFRVSPVATDNRETFTREPNGMTSIRAALTLACLAALTSSPAPNPFLSIILAIGNNVTDNSSVASSFLSSVFWANVKHSKL
jgi:hypothetical protein